MVWGEKVQSSWRSPIHLRVFWRQQHGLVRAWRWLIAKESLSIPSSFTHAASSHSTIKTKGWCKRISSFHHDFQDSWWLRGLTRETTWSRAETVFGITKFFRWHSTSIDAFSLVRKIRWNISGHSTQIETYEFLRHGPIHWDIWEPGAILGLSVSYQEW